MLKPDHVNCLFNVAGAVFSLLSVRQVRHDHSVKGIHMGTLVFFVTWNAWSAGYYFWLRQPWSGIAGCILTACNFAWLAFMLKYKRRD